MKKVYQQLRERKLQEVHKLSALIIQTLQTDGSTDSSEPMASDSSPRQQRDSDQLAQFAVDDFCVFHRGV